MEVLLLSVCWGVADEKRESAFIDRVKVVCCCWCPMLKRWTFSRAMDSSGRKREEITAFWDWGRMTEAHCNTHVSTSLCVPLHSVK